MTISNPTAPVPAYMMRIRNQIRAAEAKADESLLAKLDVMSSILRARQIEDIPAPHVGQEAIIRLGRAIQSDIDRKSVVEGKSVSVRVDPGGGRIIKKKTHINVNIDLTHN